MIARTLSVIDLDPAGYANFSESFAQLSCGHPQAVLWHEEGFPRKMLLGGEVISVPFNRILDARDTAREIYENFSGRARRVVVTDLEGYDRLYAAVNPSPEAGEGKYRFQERMNRQLAASFDERKAIYPLPDMTRGPVAFEQMRAFLTGRFPQVASLIFAVFEEEKLYFSFVARAGFGLVDLVTSFEHWPGLTREVKFSAESLDQTVERVAGELGEVAGALFLGKKDFERLYDGKRHDSLPVSLILSGAAFGYSGLPGVAENTFLKTAALFCYVPVWVP